MHRHRLRSACAGTLVLFGVVAFDVPAVLAGPLFTWDLTGEPVTTDAPDNAVPRLLGHSASYAGDGGGMLTAHAFYYAPYDLLTARPANLHRTTPILFNGLGVCSATRITAARTTDCDEAIDMPLISDNGTFEYIRLTLPGGAWRPASLTFTVIHPQDQVRVYGSNSPGVDFTSPGNLAHSASGSSDILTITFEPEQTATYRYLFVSGNTFASDSNRFLGDDFFRLASVSATFVDEPHTASLVLLAALTAGWLRRTRTRKRSIA